MAEAVNEHLGGVYEVYCLIFGENDVINDIYIPEQEADTTSVEVSEENLISIIEELEELYSGKKIIGWAHSHGDFAVFSSSTDDSNHLTILNQTFNCFLSDRSRCIIEQEKQYDQSFQMNHRWLSHFSGPLFISQCTYGICTRGPPCL